MQLTEIAAEFERVQAHNEPRRTDELVKLMNVLEREYRTFKTWGSSDSKPDLETPEMRLYRQISDARVFSED